MHCTLNAFWLWGYHTGLLLEPVIEMSDAPLACHKFSNKTSLDVVFMVFTAQSFLEEPPLTPWFIQAFKLSLFEVISWTKHTTHIHMLYAVIQSHGHYFNQLSSSWVTHIAIAGDSIHWLTINFSKHLMNSPNTTTCFTLHSADLTV